LDGRHAWYFDQIKLHLSTTIELSENVGWYDILLPLCWGRWNTPTEDCLENFYQPLMLESYIGHVTLLFEREVKKSFSCSDAWKYLVAWWVWLWDSM
jgi:hypothetical protein